MDQDRAGLVEDEWLPTVEAARLLHVTPRTLERWRVSQTGPAWMRAGRKIVRYSRQGIHEWCRAQCSEVNRHAS